MSVNTNAFLISNIQSNLDRLVQQLADLETERESLDNDEYEEFKKDTKTQLEELSATLEKMAGGNISTIDDFTATKMAIRAAISEAFKTPEIVALFARKQPAALRQKLILLDSELKMHKLSAECFTQRKIEILTALQKLGEPLSPDEQKTLSESSTPHFDLELVSTRITVSDNVVRP